MVVTFEDAYPSDLCEKRKTDDKKHRYQPELVRRYRRCVQLMKNVPDITSFAKYIELSNHYKQEPL